MKRKGLLAATKHAVCAATLSTLPIIVSEPARLDHRPRGVWLPSAASAAAPLALKKHRKIAGVLRCIPFSTLNLRACIQITPRVSPFQVHVETEMFICFLQLERRRSN